MLSPYSPSRLQLPKLHNWIYHITTAIAEHGVINSFTTETYEFLHKEWVKNPYRMSNRRDVTSQMLRTVRIYSSIISIVNCLGCSDYSYCLGCSDCLDCSGCLGCLDYSDCLDCSGCSGCLGCLGCSDCLGCLSCSDCSGCLSCSDCLDCLDCLDCSGCSGYVVFVLRSTNKS